MFPQKSTPNFKKYRVTRKNINLKLDLTMLKNIGRNNQLYMIANFLFAFGTGLWLNLRPLYLADLGAAPRQIGLALAISGLSAGFLPIPAGIISDRFGPRRVILFSWLMALLGAILAALAPTW